METIQNILIKRGYPQKAALSVVQSLLMLDSTFQPAFNSWLESEVETDFQIEGFKLSELKRKFDMTYPAALLTMDWLLKEPEKARECINRGIR